MLRTIAVHELVSITLLCLPALRQYESMGKEYGPTLIMQGLKLPVEFGTAPSTILYRGDKWTPPDESSVKLVKAKL